MRTTIDLTDETSPNDQFTVADPSSIENDDRNVLINLRETTLCLTFPQVLTLREALTRFVFRERVPVDVNDDDYIPDLEHEQLQVMVKKMLGGSLRDQLVSEDMRLAIRTELAHRNIDAESWRFLREELRDADATIKDLRDQLARTKPKGKR